MIGSLTLLSGSVLFATVFGSALGFAALTSGGVLASLGFLVASARRLSYLGFTHHDVGIAFDAELERTREELAVELRGGSRTALESAALLLSKAAGGVAGVSLLAMILAPTKGLALRLLQVFSLSFGAGLIGLIALIALRQQRRDVDTEMWSKLWKGRIGKFAFFLARKLLGKRKPESAMTHRATELSLGMAAEQLFDGLPKESRQAIGDLPGLLRRLQSDAQSLRKRYDELQEALNGAGDAAASADYDDLRAARDMIHDKLGEAVGALETIRLNLLRLHAGSATVAGLTTHLGLAAEVSDDIERLIAAHEEMERMLEFPRLATPTPV